MAILTTLLRSSLRLLAFAVLAGTVSGLAGAAVISVLPGATSSATQGRAIAFCALALLAVTSKVVSEVLLTRLGQRTIAQVRAQLSRSILEAPYARVEELGAHRLLAALHDDAATVTQAYVYLPLLCVNAATVVGCLIYLGCLSAALLGGVALAMGLGAWIFRAYERRALRHFVRARETNDALFGHFRALTSGIKELKMSRLRSERFLDGALSHSVRAYEREFVGGMTLYSLASGWGALLFYLVVGLAVFVLPSALSLSEQTVTGTTLALLYLMGPFAMIIEVLPSLGRAEVALQKWRELGLTLSSPSAVVLDGAPRSAPTADASTRDGTPAEFQRIDLLDVSMRYRGEHEDESFQLGPVSLTLRPGEVVFLVGGNGSGKTTLTLLLLGLYTPDTGSVLVDGVRVTEREREQYRQLFSVVFADSWLFEGLLDLSDPELDERARYLLRRLRLEQRVRLEQQRLVTGGLSQGQRKRLALLVAALEDRPFYVFDEWAADQDPAFRKVFYTELLPELRARGKAVLVVSHDDQYFDAADRCLRMDFGRLVESPHPSLAHSSGQPHA